MDIKRLHYFCTIVEQGQISRAAKALHISQPPLSQRLKELEDEFGTSLIVRNGRNWQVTEAGKVLYERARQLLSLIEDIPTEVMNAAEGLQGRLMVGASSMCLTHVLHRASTFSRRYPNLRHHMIVEESGRLETALKKREIDIAVMLLPIEEDLFDIRLLPRCGCSIVLSKTLAYSPDATSMQLEQIGRLPLVLPRRSRANGTWDRLLGAFQERELKPQILMNCPDVRTLLAFIDQGVEAAAIVPSSEVPPSCSARLRVLPVDAPDLHVQAAVVTLRNHHLTRATRALASHLAQVV